MSGEPGRVRAPVLRSLIDVTSVPQVLDTLAAWARERQSRYVCVCNAHVVVTASRDDALHNAVNCADLAIADGAPVAWLLRRIGYRDQTRVPGPDLMWALCQRAASVGIPIFLHGSTPRTLELLSRNLLQAFPNLHVAGAWSPPFGDPAQFDTDSDVDRINASSAGFVLVGLGCPKQELWMAAHRGRVQAVMVGVGAAFDFHAGTVKRAPVWMQHAGLEWLHRLWSEPRRLWKRYLVTNTLFIGGALRQLLVGPQR
jgi:N-acetylglucosaminyldiphosphoundecaprenol N-acetyl-beta-D-mannosaminyltransferase